MNFYIGKTSIHLNNIDLNENIIDLTIGELNLDNLNDEDKKIILQKKQEIVPVKLLNKHSVSGVKTEFNEIFIG